MKGMLEACEAAGRRLCAFRALRREPRWEEAASERAG